MSYQPFYITQYEQDTGQENYFQNFLLPEKAFPTFKMHFVGGESAKKAGILQSRKVEKGNCRENADK